jgi:DNA-binding SARP family transcriptional activator/tetratricopeptide (TPR) repeat protein
VVAGAHGAECRVLGPFEVEVSGRVVEVGGPRLGALLALLVANAGRVVSVAALVDGMWGPHAPADADRTARTYVSLLRKALPPVPAALPGQELIVTRRPGYVLRLNPDAIDASRFERLAADGRAALAAGQPAVAAERLAAALGLWRGEAYAEFASHPALRAEAARLEQVRLAALADRIEADLAAGGGGQLVAELEALTVRHPGDERLWGQLMTALYRAGRQGDALTAYRRARDAITMESGAEPTPALTGIHQQVLAQDARLLAPRPAGLADGPCAARPAQLPAAVPAFTGRAAELAGLTATLAAGGGAPGGGVLYAVCGPAGVGKTALAVHWAHQVADQFPDGQLYVNLRGFHPGGEAMAPAEAVRGFLAGLGVSADRIPSGLDAQAALYRSLLAGKRMLVVLDNARDAEQVRPLLPGSPTALVVVTSRTQLTGLVAADGAHPIALDTMSTVEARQLLTRRLGADRLAADPDATDEIIARCARLPLALTIVAARAATQPTFPLAGLAAELGEARGRLDTLTAGDPATDVRAVLSWSYQAVIPSAARLFRLLGLHPGGDISAAAAASLAGHPLPDTRRLLAELTRASLLTAHARGRYTFHDLLRTYAADLTHGTDTDEQRRAAVGRLLDHYVRTAHAADQLLYPARDPIPVPLGAPAAQAHPEHLPGSEQAMAWLAAEYPVILAALRLAAGAGFDTYAWQLAWACDTFLDRQGHWPDLAAAWQTALPAAGRLSDPAALAYAHRALANEATCSGRYVDARTHFRRALDIYRRTGDLVGQARVYHNLSYLSERQGRLGRSLGQSRQALRLYRAAGHRVGQANALNNVGWSYALLGDFDRAVGHCRQALALHQQDGNRDGEADTWDSLGYAYHQRGDHGQAAECYRRALDLFRDLGDRYDEATTLVHLGDTYHASGDPSARTAWRQALDILTDLDHPDAADVGATLHRLDREPARIR